MSNFTLPIPSKWLADFSDDDDACYRRTRFRPTPFPIDVSWLDGVHDGFALSSSPSAYVRIRREGTTPSLPDDLALWLGAMTFGLLEAVTRIRIPEEVFLAPDPHNVGRRVILGSHLGGFLAKWVHHMVDYQWPDEDARFARGKEVARILQTAMAAINEEAYSFQGGGVFPRAGMELYDHSAILAAVAFSTFALCGIAREIWPRMPELELLMLRPGLIPGGNGKSQVWEHIPRACVRTMRRAGWCPHTVTYRLIGTFPQAFMISKLFRLSPYIRQSPDEHRDCTESACKFYTVADLANYAPRHVSASCACESISPPLDDILRLLNEGEDGTIPVIVFDGMQLRVQPAANNAYLAISHVWADGIGSTTERGLSRCQVARLAGHAGRLVPDTRAFWIDSLCIPGGGSPRKRAIRLMAKTYKEASLVLVLDESIRAQSLRTPTSESVSLAIATSGWVRRIWTLQEGLLARRLVFELNDDIAAAFEEETVAYHSQLVAENGADSAVARLSLQEMDQSYRHVPLVLVRLRHLIMKTSLHQFDFSDVVDLIQGRSTSRPEDETLAISSLLSLRIDPLLAIDATGQELAELRMKECLLQLGTVSKQFAMVPGPKLSLPGYRWAPRSLSNLLVPPRGPPLARCTGEGLVGDFFLAPLATPISIQELERHRDTTDQHLILKHFLVDQSTTSTYTGVWHLYNETTSEHDTIDALLFDQPPTLDGSSVVPCAAVYRHRAEEAEGTWLRCAFVAEGVLMPLREVVLTKTKVAIGELQCTLVCIT